MNRITLMGRVTKDAEAVTRRNGDKEIKIANFYLAVDRRFKRQGGGEADFFHLASFNAHAEFAEKYLKKGTKILVHGRVETGSYTNKDGVRIPTFTIITEEIEFAERAKKDANQTGQETAELPEELPLDVGTGDAEFAETLDAAAQAEEFLNDGNPFFR